MGSIHFHGLTTVHVCDHECGGWLTVPKPIVNQSSLTADSDVVWIRCNDATRDIGHPVYRIADPVVVAADDPRYVERSRFYNDGTLGLPAPPVGGLFYDGDDVLLGAAPTNHSMVTATSVYSDVSCRLRRRMTE